MIFSPKEYKHLPVVFSLDVVELIDACPSGLCGASDDECGLIGVGGVNEGEADDNDDDDDDDIPFVKAAPDVDAVTVAIVVKIVVAFVNDAAVNSVNTSTSVCGNL